MNNFYSEMRLNTDTLWESVFNHPFVKGIGDGTLSNDRYTFFLKQDYLYLIGLSRFYSVGCAKSPTIDEMKYFASLLHTTLHVEMDLHRRTCTDFGIDLNDPENTESAMFTAAYVNLLLKTAYEGSIGDILAVHLPCAAGFVEIGKLLKSKGLPENKHYRDWINTYSSQEFEDYAMWLINRFNYYAEQASASKRSKWFDLYKSSLKFEYCFFDMSWRKEFWPNGLSSQQGNI